MALVDLDTRRTHDLLVTPTGWHSEDTASDEAYGRSLTAVRRFCRDRRIALAGCEAIDPWLRVKIILPDGKLSEIPRLEADLKAIVQSAWDAGEQQRNGKPDRAGVERTEPHGELLVP